MTGDEERVADGSEGSDVRSDSTISNTEISIGAGNDLSMMPQKPDPISSGEHLIYPIFFMLGVGTLFPWNAFINATSYFDSRLCGSARSEDYLGFFGVIFNVTEVAALACCVKYGLKQVGFVLGGE